MLFPFLKIISLPSVIISGKLDQDLRDGLDFTKASVVPGKQRNIVKIGKNLQFLIIHLFASSREG